MSDTVTTPRLVTIPGRNPDNRRLQGVPFREDDPPEAYSIDGSGATVEVRIDFYGCDPAEALAAFVEHVRGWQHSHGDGVTGARVE